MGGTRPQPSDRRRDQTEAPVVCSTTGVTIPECSCAVCITEQIRRHAPVGLEPSRPVPPRAA